MSIFYRLKHIGYRNQSKIYAVVMVVQANGATPLSTTTSADITITELYVYICKYTMCIYVCDTCRHLKCFFRERGWLSQLHDDVIKWKHFPRNWSFVRGIHRSPVNSPHKGQWRGALMFSLICAWTNSWANNGDYGDLTSLWWSNDTWNIPPPGVCYQGHLSSTLNNFNPSIKGNYIYH